MWFNLNSIFRLLRFIILFLISFSYRFRYHTLACKWNTLFDICVHQPLIFLPIGSQVPSFITHLICLCTNFLSPSAFSSTSSLMLGSVMSAVSRFLITFGFAANKGSGLFSAFEFSGRARMAQTHKTKMHIICKTKQKRCDMNVGLFNVELCDNYYW